MREARSDPALPERAHDFFPSRGDLSRPIIISKRAALPAFLALLGAFFLFPLGVPAAPPSEADSLGFGERFERSLGEMRRKAQALPRGDSLRIRFEALETAALELSRMGYPEEAWELLTELSEASSPSRPSPWDSLSPAPGPPGDSRDGELALPPWQDRGASEADSARRPVPPASDTASRIAGESFPNPPAAPGPVAAPGPTAATSRTTETARPQWNGFSGFLAGGSEANHPDPLEPLLPFTRLGLEWKPSALAAGKVTAGAWLSSRRLYGDLQALHAPAPGKFRLEAQGRLGTVDRKLYGDSLDYLQTLGRVVLGGYGKPGEVSLRIPLSVEALEYRRRLDFFHSSRSMRLHPQALWTSADFSRTAGFGLFADHVDFEANPYSPDQTRFGPDFDFAWSRPGFGLQGQGTYSFTDQASGGRTRWSDDVQAGFSQNWLFLPRLRQTLRVEVEGLREQGTADTVLLEERIITPSAGGPDSLSFPDTLYRPVERLKAFRLHGLGGTVTPGIRYETPGGLSLSLNLALSGYRFPKVDSLEGKALYLPQFILSSYDSYRPFAEISFYAGEVLASLTFGPSLVEVRGEEENSLESDSRGFDWYYDLSWRFARNFTLNLGGSGSYQDYAGSGRSGFWLNQASAEVKAELP